MSDVLKELELMCESHATMFTHKGNGHVQLKGHGVLVNYYPLSKQQTIFCNGVTTKNCTPWDAVKMCKVKGKTGLKPKNKHISKNPPEVQYGVQHLGSVVKHFYEGEKAPWEHPNHIMCWPDILRIRAYKLLEQADNMENPEYYKDGLV